MITQQTIDEWDRIDRGHRFNNTMWLALLALDLFIAAWSYSFGWMNCAIADSFFAGFALAALLANRAARRSFEQTRLLVISYDAALDQANEAMQLLSDGRHHLSPPIEPSMWPKETRH